jgi:hypothetical protein
VLGRLQPTDPAPLAQPMAKAACRAFEPIQISKLNSNDFEFESNLFELHLIQTGLSHALKILNKILL